MKIKLIGALLALSIGAVQAAVVSYDFENLTGSGYPGTDIIGQDAWNGSGYPTVYQTASWPSSGNSLFGRGSGWSLAERVNDSNWGFQITGDNIQIAMTMRMASANIPIGLFRLGQDADNSGILSGNEMGFSFGVRYDFWEVQPAPNSGLSSPTAVPVGTSGSEVIKAVLDIDLGANGGDGSGSLSIENITLGGSLTPVAGLQNVNLEILSMDNPNPATWDTVWLAAGGYTQIDDLTISGDVIPEPATMGLLGIFGAGMLFLRRRMKI
jgi:hypothetical protein